ncbi:energy-coupled thiamine transporter ThiT [Halobacillus shinanisalinarum]|uniref:Energy-coupled thiamine transporter ThiT n=1 Tax=Halobacillus shinanisalinarum TaxID=2932258 RepID=A0ABY4GY08_9BACI|nr:energy-coupled thiamine transporter ThiT [Halobacillus shinanisalinarum]UOQ92949.1 energy-coupled thiamine transporter ThiT [Halobacillus shinanisalinarum]
MQNKRVLFMVEVAIFSALAILLDIIPFLSFKLWAQGGSVSFAMVPVFIMAFRWGLRGGLLTGLLLGFYQILVGGAILISIAQTFLDYFVAFGVIGLAGIFAKPVREAARERHMKRLAAWVIAGSFVGSLFRFFGHFTAGIVFYDEFAPEGQPVWLYSLLYNGGYMLPTFILSAVILCLLFSQRPTLLISRS